MDEFIDLSRLKKVKESDITKKEILDSPVTQMDYSTLPEPNGEAEKIYNFTASIGEIKKQKAKKRPDDS
ncbi:MAG: hypothetical protein ACE5HY_03985 [Candidatus Hydrothermarchaeales archaeon]